MYKILTKMHTQRDGIYQTYMILSQDKQMVEYATEDKEEAKQMALTLLKTVGYKDLRIVDDQDYYIDIINIQDNLISQEDEQDAENLLGQIGYGDLYLSNDAQYDIDLIWGKKPEPAQDTFTATILDNGEITAAPWEITNIPIHGEAVFRIQPKDPESILGFHLFINGVACGTGIPEWLIVETFDDSTVSLTAKDITQDIVLSVQFDREQ